jgi:phage portal protein BeeE
MDAVPALQPEREALWARLEAASFLTDEERRRMAGVGA